MIFCMIFCLHVQSHRYESKTLSWKYWFCLPMLSFIMFCTTKFMHVFNLAPSTCWEQLLGLLKVSESKDSCSRLTSFFVESWLFRNSSWASAWSKSRTESRLISLLTYVLNYYTKVDLLAVLSSAFYCIVPLLHSA